VEPGVTYPYPPFQRVCLTRSSIAYRYTTKALSQSHVGVCCRFVRMQRRWGENVGGRAKPLCGLLLVVSLVVIVVILLQPKLSFLPQHYSVAVLSVTINATLNSQDSRPIFTVFHNAAPPWDRLATFYILTSLKDDRSVSAMLAQTVGDCRGLPVDGTLSLTCQKPSDIYLLYSNSDELQAAQVAVNATRYCPVI